MSFEEKIQEHWTYLREAIRGGRDEDSYIHLSIRDYLAIIGYHYKTAMLHGYKHKVQIMEEEETKDV